MTLKKGPPQKSYLPVFIAPEAHGKQKQRQPNSVEKDVEERIARAEKEKEKRARLAAKKKKKAVAPQARAAADDDEEDENWKLMLTIAIGVLVALTEAIDIDILLGILFIPVMSVMKRLSDYFDTEALDPAVWIAAISNGYNNLCKEHPAVRASPLWRNPRTTLTASSPTSFVASDEPLFHPGAHPPRSPSAPRGSSAPQEEMPRRCPVSRPCPPDMLPTGGLPSLQMHQRLGATLQLELGRISPPLWCACCRCAWRRQGFVLADFGTFALFVNLILFEADLRKWWSERHLRAQGYGGVDEEGEADEGPSEDDDILAAATDPERLQLLLRRAREDLEAADLEVRLQEKHGRVPLDEAALLARRERLSGRISMLNEFLAAVETSKAEEVDLEAAAKEAAKAEAAKAKQGNCGENTKLAVTVLKNTIAGALSIYLYFMDLISDIQVRMGELPLARRAPHHPRAAPPPLTPERLSSRHAICNARAHR